MVCPRNSSGPEKSRNSRSSSACGASAPEKQLQARFPVGEVDPDPVGREPQAAFALRDQVAGAEQFAQPVQRLLARRFRLVAVQVRPQRILQAFERAGMVLRNGKHAQDVERAGRRLGAEIDDGAIALDPEVAQHPDLDRPGPALEPARRRSQPALGDHGAALLDLEIAFERIRQQLREQSGQVQQDRRPLRGAQLRP